MIIALWDHPICSVLEAGLRQVRGAEVVLLHPSVCAQALRSGEVDLALLSPLEILQDVADFDVLPSVALSVWTYPFARLALPGALGIPVPTVHYDRRFPYAALITRIILAEHYDVEPAFVPCGVCDVDDLLKAGEAVIITEPSAPDYEVAREKPEQGTLLDVGLEWTELSNYPLVLGLLAAQKGKINEASVRGATEMAEAADGVRHEVAHKLNDYWHEYFETDVRFRFDDLATAGLTEFSQYLLFYGVLDEVPDLPVVYLDRESGNGRTPLL